MPVPCWLKEPLLEIMAHPEFANRHKGQVHLEDGNAQEIIFPAKSVGAIAI